HLLAEIVHDPECPLGRYQLLSAQDLALLANWATGAPMPSAPHGNLTEAISQQAQRTPLHTALLSSTEAMTYAQVEQRSNQLAHWLESQGVGPESRVGVCLERGVQMIVSLLAILKAGGAYVPLDPTYPQERLRWLQHDARITLLLTQQTLASWVDDPAVRIVCLDQQATIWEHQPISLPFFRGDAANLAYLIYTSGSTGRPKGVMVTHASAIRFVQWARSLFSPQELQGVLASTSLCFDLSVFEIFVPLSVGGTVLLAENALALPEYPHRERVTLLNTVPSAAAELVRQHALPEGVQTINLAGEALGRTLVEQLEGMGQVQRIYNLYGPSEDTTYSTVAQVAGGKGSVPIGHPISGSRAYVLDGNLQQVPIGVRGELYLAGDGLARGYLERADLTAERFVPDPLGEQPGGRLYRTGDLVRYTQSGDMEFLGRRDQQVKIRGFRIELGEIESVLRRQTGVCDAVVAVREEGTGTKYIVAYMVYNGQTHEQEVRTALQQSLPSYMVPAVFV